MECVLALALRAVLDEAAADAGPAQALNQDQGRSRARRMAAGARGRGFLW